MMSESKVNLQLEYEKNAMYNFVKGDLIEELERLDVNDAIVNSYKDIRRPFLIREIQDINKSMGLPKNDGVEKWTSKE